MHELTSERLTAYRAETYHTRSNLRLRSVDQAVEFVNKRGFIFFWPNKDFPLMPSLWAAVAGDRPVPDTHDDPGHVTWGWKDKMLGKKRWYYGRILRRRNTIVSMANAPYFYALSPNYGDMELDYLEQYQLGRMTMESRSVYEALLKEGPLDTISLRKEARLSSESSSSRFNRALDDMQVEMKIMPIGVAEVGAWKYAFIYDIVPRHLPEVQEQARFLSDEEARDRLVGDYLRSVGAAPLDSLKRLFGWPPLECAQSVERLKESGQVVNGVTVSGQRGEWVSMASLLE